MPKPSESDLGRSVLMMQGVIPFFPDAEIPLTIILRLMRDMINTVDELDWLTTTACNTMQKWEGFAQLRGLFCARFKPADGLFTVCTIPGFTGRELLEAASVSYLERQTSEVDKNLIEWKRQAKLDQHRRIEAGEVAPPPIPLPVVKKIPKPLLTRDEIRKAEEELERSKKPPRTEEENRRLTEELARQLETLNRG